jgi:hypothetical protein
LKCYNFSINLTDILDSDFFKVTAITNGIYKIIPLFNTGNIASSNNEDKILDNNVIIAEKKDKETYYTFSSNDDSVEDYLAFGEYYTVGDTLSIADYNGIVSLLRENITTTENISLKNEQVQGIFGKYVFDLESVTITDRGVLITNETISNLGTVKLQNPVFSNSSYELHLTIKHMTDYNVNPDNSTDHIITENLIVELEENEEVIIPFNQYNYNYTVLFNAEVKIKHDRSIIMEG